MLLEEAKTDWLGSRNIYYNTESKLISDNINDLIDINNLKFNSEGLCNYLDYGYSVFEQTPIEGIKILPANTEIKKIDGRLRINKLKDCFEDDLGKITHESDVLDYLHELVLSFQFRHRRENIIIPTSGGFDSRLIQAMLKGDTLLSSYSYGANQDNDLESRDVVYARALCEKMGREWSKIELGTYHEQMESWYELYGVTTHAHGMYQMEFYRNIRQKHHFIGSEYVISGILGDVWAGSWEFDDIKTPEEMYSLGKTYGLHADSDACKVKRKNNHVIRDSFFDSCKEKMNDPIWRVIIAARMKVVLLSYLLRVPERYGYEVWSPFLDYKAVVGMLNIPIERRRGRKWQIDYFKKKDLLVGDWGLLNDNRQINNIYEMAFIKSPLNPLNVKLLGRIIDEHYIERINSHISNMGADNYKWYHAYLTLWPLQKIIEQCEGDIEIC